jgi:hypothetical protein
MGDVNLDVASDRIDAGQDAGDSYTGNMETIQAEVTGATGSTLGNMVGAQLSLTEAETTYQVESGVPNKASKAVKAAASKVAQ